MKIERNVHHSTEQPPDAAIAAVARSRFRRFGYAKTSMQEIAADCGMSVANLYRYYDGKLAIGGAVTAAEQAALFAACDEAVAQAPGDLSERLFTLFSALIDGTRHQIKTSPLLFELGMAVAREQPQHRQRILAETERRIAAILAAQRGNPPADDATAAAAHLILMACSPFVLPWMLRTQPFGNPRGHVAPLVRCLVRGLAEMRAETAMPVPGSAAPD